MDTYMIGPNSKKMTVADLIERLHHCDPQKIIEVSQCCDNQYYCFNPRKGCEMHP